MINETKLYHHGIRGMKWGERNGPPYPLGASNHSVSEKRAGWRKSLDKPNTRQHNKGNSNENPKKQALTEKQKRAIKIGAAVAVTALATYGTYKLVKSGKLDKFVDSGKNKVDELLGKKAGSSDFGKQKIDDLLQQQTTQKTKQYVGEIKKLSKPESLAETLKNVNTHEGSVKNYGNNCTLCSIATFLRQQGLDVKAGSTGGSPQSVVEMVNECFKGARTTTGSAVKFGRSRQDAAEMLLHKYGQNAEGVCSIQWKSRSGGHAFNWKIKDGIVSFFDGQANQDDDYVSRIYWKDINPNGGLELARLDGAEINFASIKKWLE